MRILMITYLPPENEGRVHRSIIELSKKNEIDIITCNSKNRISNNVHIISIPTSNKSNIKKYLEFVVKTIWIIVKKKDKYDLIYAHNYFASFPAIVLSWFKYSKRIVYDAYELLIPSGGSTFSLRDYFFYALEKIVIKKAVKIICANEIRGYIMLGHYDLKDLPVVVQNITSTTTNEIKIKQINDNTIFTIVYAGYVFADRSLDKLINAVNHLGSKYKLLIAGEGPEVNNLKKIVTDSNIKNVTFTGKYSIEELKDILDDCHIGYISYPNYGLNNIYCAPNKISEYAYAGLPIIATENLGLEYILNKFHIGVATNNISEGIREIVKNYSYYSKNIINYLHENNWTIEAEKLSKAVELAILDGEK